MGDRTVFRGQLCVPYNWQWTVYQVQYYLHRRLFNTCTSQPLCTFPTFSPSDDTHPISSAECHLLVLESCHSALSSYPPTQTHPQTTVPRPLVTVAGLRVGHMPQGGSFCMFPYACPEKKVFGGWNCSPGRIYRQTFSHSQEDSRDASYVYRGNRTLAEKQPWPHPLSNRSQLSSVHPPLSVSNIRHL